MAGSLRQAAMKRRGAKADKVASASAGKGNTLDKGFSFKKSGVSASYRGAAKKSMRGGTGSYAAHVAGIVPVGKHVEAVQPSDQQKPSQ